MNINIIEITPTPMNIQLHSLRSTPTKRPVICIVRPIKNIQTAIQYNFIIVFLEYKKGGILPLILLVRLLMFSKKVVRR